MKDRKVEFTNLCGDSRQTEKLRYQFCDQSLGVRIILMDPSKIYLYLKLFRFQFWCYSIVSVSPTIDLKKFFTIVVATRSDTSLL